MAHKLRIAVSVLFGLLTVAISVLWMRSYRYSEAIGCFSGYLKVSAWSASGHAAFRASKLPADFPTQLAFDTEPMRSGIDKIFESRCNAAGFWYYSDANSYHLYFPYWSLALMSVVLAACSAPITRFSLRMLLIATTLVAIALGLSVWLAR
jgi:hypothetical protein